MVRTARRRTAGSLQETRVGQRSDFTPVNETEASVGVVKGRLLPLRVAEFLADELLQGGTGPLRVVGTEMLREIRLGVREHV